ncbi:MAG: CvpA family protein [Planctomycetes bacterium]|nr:CvpA family protein [Planctomycetota bacterium]MBI3845800.1 CvpA family protein [Planctomycetota bacterium]
MGWNWIDIVLILLILASVIAGFVKGFAWQVIRLLFLFFGILLAKAYAEPLGVQLRPLLGSNGRPPADRYVAYAILLTVIYVSSLGLAFGIRTAVEKMKLSSFDRLLGGVLGLLKGILVAYAAFVFVAVVKADDTTIGRALRDSQSARVVAGIDTIVHPLFPPEFHDQIESWRKPSRRQPASVRIDWQADSEAANVEK